LELIVGVGLLVDVKEGELGMKEEELKLGEMEVAGEPKAPQNLKKLAHERYEARCKGSFISNL
jgi:hypothetical protein